MFKNVLLSLATINVGSLVITPMATNRSETISEDELLKQEIYEKLENEKISLGAKEYYEMDNIKFSDKNLLQEYILNNNLIEPVLTSSDPNKILRDHENQILNSEKIYDTDVSQFLKVYRDAFGNVAKTSQEALNTYTNEGNVKAMYSYNGENWFDDSKEAEIHQKDQMNIEKSIFYLYGNNYYNAFNKDDMQVLIDKFNPGYYINRTKTLAGTNSINPIKLYGDKKLGYDSLKLKLRDDFINDYYFKVVNLKSSFKTQFGITGGNEIRITYNNEKTVEYKKNDKKPLVEFVHNFKSYADFLKDFKTRSKWQSSYEDNLWGSGRNFWYRYFNTIKDGKKTTAKIALYPHYVHVGYKSNPSFSNYSYTDKTESQVEIFIDSNKDKKDYVDTIYTTKMYDTELSTFELILNVYDKWFDSFWDKVITNFGDKNNDKVLFTDIINNIFIKNKDGTTYKDRVYKTDLNNSSQQSVIKSYLDFLPKREEILSNPILQNGKNMYKLREDFLVSEENLRNFIPLQGDITTLTKYVYGTDMTVSSLDGAKLSNTYEEAKEKSFINQNLSLRKKYIAFDVFGNKTELANTLEEAINLLQSKINLQGKMIHKKEYEMINWTIKSSFESLISSGRYKVYRVLDKYSNKYIYYSTFEAALKSVLSSTSINTKTYFLNQYLFRYKNLNNKNEYSVIFYEGDESNAVNNIFDQIKQNSINYH